MFDIQCAYVYVYVYVYSGICTKLNQLLLLSAGSRLEYTYIPILLRVKIYCIYTVSSTHAQYPEKRRKRTRGKRKTVFCTHAQNPKTRCLCISAL